MNWTEIAIAALGIINVVLVTLTGWLLARMRARGDERKTEREHEQSLNSQAFERMGDLVDRQNANIAELEKKLDADAEKHSHCLAELAEVKAEYRVLKQSCAALQKRFTALESQLSDQDRTRG